MALSPRPWPASAATSPSQCFTHWERRGQARSGWRDTPTPISSDAPLRCTMKKHQNLQNGAEIELGVGVSALSAPNPHITTPPRTPNFPPPRDPPPALSIPAALSCPELGTRLQLPWKIGHFGKKQPPKIENHTQNPQGRECASSCPLPPDPEGGIWGCPETSSASVTITPPSAPKTPKTSPKTNKQTKTQQKKTIVFY